MEMADIRTGKDDLEAHLRAVDPGVFADMH